MRCLLLIENPKATTEELLKIIPGPDFPTGGIVVEPPESIREAYETGRGGFRVRARWHTEDLGRGMWRIVVTEIPHLVQKSKLVEALAATDRGQEGAAAGRCARRERRRDAPRAGAEGAHGRAGGADGELVQAHGAGNAHFAQHERAGRAMARRA